MELTRTIPASPERAFSVLADLNQARQWMPAIQSIEPLSQGAFGVGTSSKETRSAGKRILESTIRVVACDPASRIGLAVEARPMTGQMEFTLSPAGTGAQVRYRAEMKRRGFMRLMSGTINRMMEREDADLLERLERQVAGSR